MLGGNQVITIKSPQGRWGRGPDDTAPPDHCIDEQNLEFSHGQVGSRLGINTTLTASGGWDGTVKRVHVFKRVGEANRLLILDANGKIYDSTNLVSEVLSVAGMIDFACVILFNRAYIAPSTGQVGKTGEKVYVYDGTTIRAAAGNPPSGHTMAGADGAAGKVEKGNHLFAVAYETGSGFITAPGLGTGEYVNVESAGDKQVDLSGMPASGSWPAGTKAVHILATTLLAPSYNGNPAEQAWYFIPNARYESGDFAAGTKTVDFYDADLLTSADYLQYQLTEIPAGCKLSSFNGRLIVCGQPTNDNIVLVSKSGEPESISETNGYIIVDPGDMGGGVKNAIEHRGLLYLTKSSRTYVTNDNGSSPSTWETNQVDASIGCEPLGTSALLDTKGATKDQFIIADRSGLYAFIGSYNAERDLSYKIRDDWRNINPAYFHLVQVCVDPIKERIYVAVPDGTATSPDTLYVGDYQEGFTWDRIRWSKWSIPGTPTSIWTETDYTTQLAKFRYGSAAASIWEQGTTRTDNAGATLITAYARFGHITFQSEGAVNHYTALRMRARGYGELKVTLRTLDSAVTTFAQTHILSETPGKEVAQWINQESEELSVEVKTNSTYATNPSWFTLTHLRIAGNPRWATRPM